MQKKWYFISYKRRNYNEVESLVIEEISPNIVFKADTAVKPLCGLKRKIEQGLTITLDSKEKLVYEGSL